MEWDDKLKGSVRDEAQRETAAVRHFYDEIVAYEWSRLDHYVLEFAAVRHYFQRFLPPPPARALDVGGGPGRYAVLLAQAGYDVTLVDLAPRNVDWANGQFHQANVADHARALLGDARDLGAYAGAGFDVALLMGPLYHLPLAADRARALRGIHDALKSGGVAFTMSLTRAAAIYEGLNRWPEGILERAGVDQLLTTGAGFNFERNPHDFEGVYHATVAEVTPLHEAAGFRTLALAGCEAMLGGRRAEIERMAPEIQAAWVALALRLCEDTTLLGAAERLLYVGVTN